MKQDKRDLDASLELLAKQLAPKDPLWRRLSWAYQARRKARAAVARADGRIVRAVAAVADRYVALMQAAEARVDRVLGYAAAPTASGSRMDDSPSGQDGVDPKALEEARGGGRPLEATEDRNG